MAKENEQIRGEKVTHFNFRDLLFTIVGGVGLILSTSILQVFFSTPPSRAEFNGLEHKIENFDKDLEELKSGQKKIINYLIQRR